MEQIKSELIEYLKLIETFSKDSAQDGQALHSYLIELTNIGARANYLKVEFMQQYRKEKKQAYLNLIASSAASEKYFAPSLARDYVDSCCQDTAYMYELADRLGASVVHTCDALRTIISSLKSERQFANY